MNTVQFGNLELSLIDGELCVAGTAHLAATELHALAGTLHQFAEQLEREQAERLRDARQSAQLAPIAEMFQGLIANFGGAPPFGGAPEPTETTETP